MSNVVQLPNILPSGDIRPLIPNGTYNLYFQGYETQYYFGKSPKLVMHFQIVDLGPYFETPLTRWYSVERFVGKPARNGGFKAKGQTSVFLIEYFNCFPFAKRPTRLDRIPMNEWDKHVFKAKVSSVKENSKQTRLPEQIQYSKIECLLGVNDDF